MARKHLQVPEGQLLPGILMYPVIPLALAYPRHLCYLKHLYFQADR